MLTWLCSETVFVLSMLTVLTSECQLGRLELLLLSFFFNQELVLGTGQYLCLRGAGQIWGWVITFLR